MAFYSLDLQLTSDQAFKLSELNPLPEVVETFYPGVWYREKQAVYLVYSTRSVNVRTPKVLRYDARSFDFLREHTYRY